MSFEWDEEKREANIKKHGVDFLRAAKIFVNPVLERPDEREDYGEDRLIVTGHWQEYFVVVVYTWCGENRRIISAWKAGKDEKEEYYEAIYG